MLDIAPTRDGPAGEPVPAPPAPRRPGPAPAALASALAGATLPDVAATFAERGVAVPFTSPDLVGARLRLSVPGTSPELLLPAAGGRGMYVVAWQAALDLAAPTLHDRQLWARLRLLPAVTPAAVRQAARTVAAGAHAGRPARDAAVAALHAHAQLREAILAALGGRMPGRPATEAHDLAEALADVGAGEEAGHGPLASRLGGLRDLAGLVASCAGGSELLGAAAQGLVAAAEETARAVTAQAASLRAALAGARAALSRDPHAAALLLRQAQRPDLLLDGWDLPVALLRDAGPAARGAALLEAVAHLPLLPREAAAWGAAAAPDELVRLRRRAAARSRAAMTRVDLVARNERLRALVP